MSSTNKKFVTGAAILAIAGILAKCLSLFFRIPLANESMLGDIGIGYYQLPYPIYSLLISISYLGLPTAISKLVSERIAKDKYKEAHEIFKNTFILLVIFGVVSSALMLGFADLIVESQGWPKEAIYSLYGLGLAPFFVAIMGAFRGYFQGMQNMTPTAVSQLLESFVRVIIGVGLAALLLKYGLGVAAGGASFGATAGAIAGAIALFIVYFMKRKDIKKNFTRDIGSTKMPFGKTALLVISVALPITLGAAINSIISLIDSNVIVRRLVEALGETEESATALYGILSGKAITLINVPLTISMAIILSIMPAISEAVALKLKKELHEKIELGIRFALLLGLPSAAGLAILAPNIMKLLYGATTGGGFTLAVLSISLIFIILGQLFAAVLQGMGHFYLPLINLAISALFKYVLTYALVAVPALNINGAALATVITYLIYCVLNYVFVVKYAEYKISDKMLVVIKPVIATIIMSIITMGAYNLLNRTGVFAPSIVTLVSVACGGLTYLILLFVLKIIRYEDFDNIPGGGIVKKFIRH